MTDALHVLDAIRQRRSVRRFLPAPVPKDLLLRVMEEASWAPSASNRQDWEFVAILSTGVRAKLAEQVRDRWSALVAHAGDSGVADELERYSGNFEWFARAPAVVIVACKKPDSFLTHLTGEAAAEVAGHRASAAMAAQNLMLAAHALGLGTCCLTGPLVAADALRSAAGLGARKDIVCLIAVGYPAEIPPAPPQRPVEEIGRFVE